MADIFWMVFFLLPFGYYANGFGNFGNQSVFYFAPTALANRINENCIKDSKYYVQALVKGSPWARKMYESSGKLPEFIPDPSDITHHQTGWYDQCISIQPEGIRFEGQYCSILMDVKSNKNPKGISRAKRLKRPSTIFHIIDDKKLYTVGMCLPSTCSDYDLRTAIVQGIATEPNTSIIVRTGEKYCSTRSKITKQSTLDGPAILVLAFLVTLCVTVLMATVREWRDGVKVHSDTSFSLRALQSFSAISNAKTLFSCSSQSTDDMSCLHGIRVVTAIWVLVSHSCLALLTRNIYNRNDMIQDSLKWPNQIFINATVSVDTFFVLSGLLVAKSLLRDLDRGRLQLVSFYFHRYARLTPVFAVILAFVTLVWSRLGSGPQWTNVEFIAEDCQSRWWIHLLYFNNYKLKDTAMNCMGETWYLACDMQMLLVSPLVIYPLWRWRRAGLTWALLVMAFSIGINIAARIAWDLPPTFITSRPSVMKASSRYFTDYYMQPYFRFPPYLFGIMLAWLLHRTKGSPIALKPLVVVFGWVTAALIGFLVIFGMSPYLDEAQVPVIQPLIAVTYGSLHSLAWAVAVSWLIFACVHGYGGCMNQVLSWKLFVPMGRLTFIVYLTHYTYIATYHGLSRKPLDFSMMFQWVFLFGIIVWSFTMAVIIALIVEIPFVNLEQLITSNKKPPLEKTNRAAIHKKTS